MRRRVRIAFTARARPTGTGPDPGQAQPPPIVPTGAPWQLILRNPNVAARNLSRRQQPPSERRALQGQMRYLRAFSTCARVGDLEAINQAGLGEIIANDLTQDTGALSVNDPHRRQPRHVSVVEITIELRNDLLGAPPSHVELHLGYRPLSGVPDRRHAVVNRGVRVGGGPGE